jgi:hypothetical protein
MLLAKVETVTAESERQIKRLQDERKLQDVPHLRGFFDEVGAASERAQATYRTLAVLKSEPPSPQEEIRAAIGDAYEARLAVGVALDRIALRFAPESKPFATYSALTNLAEGRCDTLIVKFPTPITDDQDKEDTELAARAVVAFQAFAAAARAEISRSVSLAEAA